MKRFLITLLLLALPLSCPGAEPLGTVARQQGQAEVESPQPRELSVGAQVADADVVVTGEGARLLFTMADGTALTLGEHSRFAFSPALLDGGTAPLQLLGGAFRLTTENKQLEVVTPMGVIGIRGTDFWGGFLDTDDFGVFLFSGKPVTVRNDYGQVELAPGQGTNLAPGKAPTPPGAWGDGRLQRAKDTVTFD